MHPLLIKLDTWTKALPAWAKAISSLFLVGLVAWLDYMTGNEMSLSLFYFLPVLFSAWFFGGWAAFLVSALCALATLITDIIVGSTVRGQVMAWNAFISFGIYLTLSLFARALQRTIERESRLARTDAITGAANLRSFMETLGAEIERSRRYRHPIVLAYFDMDHFKAVNDSYGHRAGDDLLRRVAHSVRSRLRSSDLLARIGGDEFALLMPETGAAAGEAVIRKVRDTVKADCGDLNLPVSFSAGVLACENPTWGAEEFLHAADELMYEAKRSGGNHILARTMEADR